jgi:Retrotransposon gag protein
MYMVVNQFLSADVKTWVKTLHVDSWVRLQKEMVEYYVDPLEEDRAWNSLNKLQQTGSVQEYSDKLLQLIVKVGNNVTEKDKLRCYVEGLKEEVRTVIRVGMVYGRYTIFDQVKGAAEALDFELWRSRRQTLSCGGRVGRLIPLDRPLIGRPKSPPPGLLVVALPTTIRQGVTRYL